MVCLLAVGIVNLLCCNLSIRPSLERGKEKWGGGHFCHVKWRVCSLLPIACKEVFSVIGRSTRIDRKNRCLRRFVGRNQLSRSIYSHFSPHFCYITRVPDLASPSPTSSNAHPRPQTHVPVPTSPRPHVPTSPSHFLPQPLFRVVISAKIKFGNLSYTSL